MTVLAVSAVVAVSVVTASPLNSTPLFRDPDFWCGHFSLFSERDLARNDFFS